MAFFYFCTMKNYFILAILTVTLFACGSNAAQSQYKASTLTTAEYHKLLQEKKDIQLIDVRTPGEFSEDHLANAINIDFNAADFEQKIQQLDKNKATFIYCLSGGRSSGALDVMTKLKFKEVYNMKGGIMQWKGDDYPIQNNMNESSWKGITKEEYEKQIQGDVPVLVDFNASWCGPCKKLKPILDEIAKEYAGKIKIIALDVDVNKSLADEMKITNIPLLIYHKNGQVVNNIEGFSEKDALIKTLGLSK